MSADGAGQAHQRTPPIELFAIVPAAGSGCRLGVPERKVGLEVAGRSLVSWSIEALISAPGLSAGVLVVHPDDLRRAREEWLPAAGAKGWQVVAGGQTRRQSVRAGLELVEESVTHVVIHDAARPLLSAADRDRVIAEARTHGAAILASPVTDTVFRVTGQTLAEALPRQELVLAETPQVFARNLILDAHRQAPESLAATDDAMLVRHLGHDVRLVRAEDPNPKVTFPVDLDLILAYLDRTKGS